MLCVKLRHFCGFLLFSFLFANAWAQAQLTHLQIASFNNQTQVTLELTDKVSFKNFTLENPARYVLDLKNTSNATHTDKKKLDDTFVSAVRFGKTDQDLRVVFDLNQKTNVTLDAQNKTLKLFFGTEKPAPTPIAEPKKVTLTSNQALKNQNRPVVVVIDAGHGGKDPGAKGFLGTEEKKVVLQISQELVKLINQQPGMQARMTREGDYYLTLRERLAKARRAHADIFIAVHADAYRDPYSKGAAVYALSLKGASSEAARWLAAKENYSELGGVDLSDKGDMLRSVLIDLSQTATISSSLQLGSSVLGSLGQVCRLHHNNVEQAPFVVLKSPDIPSILVETGFISNPDEEKRLKDPAYQHKLASQIVQGLNTYCKKQPPEGTWLAQQKSQNALYS